MKSSTSPPCERHKASPPPQSFEQGPEGGGVWQIRRVEDPSAPPFPPPLRPAPRSADSDGRRPQAFFGPPASDDWRPAAARRRSEPTRISDQSPSDRSGSSSASLRGSDGGDRRSLEGSEAAAVGLAGQERRAPPATGVAGQCFAAMRARGLEGAPTAMPRLSPSVSPALRFSRPFFLPLTLLPPSQLPPFLSPALRFSFPPFLPPSLLPPFFLPPCGSPALPFSLPSFHPSFLPPFSRPAFLPPSFPSSPFLPPSLPPIALLFSRPPFLPYFSPSSLPLAKGGAFARSVLSVVAFLSAVAFLSVVAFLAAVAQASRGLLRDERYGTREARFGFPAGASLSPVLWPRRPAAFLRSPARELTLAPRERP